MLEQGTQTPSPSPDLIPAENHKLLPRTYMETGTSNGGQASEVSTSLRIFDKGGHQVGEAPSGREDTRK